MAQIVSTYGILSQTHDEAAHIGTGMEWIQHHKYTAEHLHPPLARIAVAMGPFVAGRRLTNPNLTRSIAWREGNDLLFDGSYFRNLALVV